MDSCTHCGQQHPAGTPSCPVTGESMAQRGHIGSRLDRYQVQTLLGSGGFGAVYVARHVHTDAEVALKVLKRNLSADAGMIERFLREAKAAAAVGSPHIVQVLDAGQAQDGTAFLAMELLRGKDLKELVQAEGQLSPMRLLIITGQVLEALEAAHARGIVHRDMKPANVFIERRQDDNGVERDYVKLLDFGISKMHAHEGTSGLTMTGIALGTPSYMAPEQFFDAKNVDGRADVYSVAVMLYELLAGRLPFDAQSYAELIVKVRTEPPAPLAGVAPHLPAQVVSVVMRGLAKEREARWPSAWEFAQALKAARPSLGQTPSRHPGQAVGGLATPSGRAADGSESMLMGKTATPASIPQKPAAPLPVSSGTAPNVLASPSLQRDMRAGPPGTPAPTPGPAVVHSGLTPAPWSPPVTQAQPVPPPASAAPRPVAAPQQGRPASPPKSGGMGAGKIVLIVLGVLFLLGGCCTCGAIAVSASQQQDSSN